MAGTGGARPGAGRKPKTEKFETKINAAEKKIADHLPELLDNLLILAKGVTVQEVDREGGVHVYTKPPDFKSNEYLVNRVMGKPTERQELSGTDGKPIALKMSYDDLRTLSPDELLRLRQEHFR